jgi:hypothetical protein
MQLTGPGAIIVDYQDGDWVITDTDRNIEARTNDAGLVFGIVQGFQAADDDASGPYRDSGDENPHA